MQDKEVCFKVCYNCNHYENLVAMSLDKLEHFESNHAPLHYACATFVYILYRSQEQAVIIAYKSKEIKRDFFLVTSCEE